MDCVIIMQYYFLITRNKLARTIVILMIPWSYSCPWCRCVILVVAVGYFLESIVVVRFLILQDKKYYFVSSSFFVLMYIVQLVSRTERQTTHSVVACCTIEEPARRRSLLAVAVVQRRSWLELCLTFPPSPPPFDDPRCFGSSQSSFSVGSVWWLPLAFRHPERRLDTVRDYDRPSPRRHQSIASKTQNHERY